jgi:hypothetical protein
MEVSLCSFLSSLCIAAITPRYPRSCGFDRTFESIFYYVRGEFGAILAPPFQVEVAGWAQAIDGRVSHSKGMMRIIVGEQSLAAER